MQQPLAAIADEADQQFKLFRTWSESLQLIIVVQIIAALISHSQSVQRARNTVIHLKKATELQQTQCH